MSHQKLHFVVPSYNRCDILSISLKKNLLFCKSLGRKLILIDNGSTDGTRDLCSIYAAEYAENFLYLRNIYNHGLGYSVWRAIVELQNPFMLISDEDTISSKVKSDDIYEIEGVIDSVNISIISTSLFASNNAVFYERNTRSSFNCVNFFEDGYLSGIVINMSCKDTCKLSLFSDTRNLYPHLTAYFLDGRSLYRYNKPFICANLCNAGKDYLSKEWFSGYGHWHEKSVLRYIEFLISAFPSSQNLINGIDRIHLQYFQHNKKLLPFSIVLIGLALEYSPSTLLKLCASYLRVMQKIALSIIRNA